jgi:hypothetical protein
VGVATWSEEWIGADHPAVVSDVQGAFLRRYMVKLPNDERLDMELSALMKSYGYNGSSMRDWAYYADVEAEFEMVILANKRQKLLNERARRLGEPIEEPEPLSPEQRLFRLRLSRWIGRYFVDQRRQRTVCEALGEAWPPKTRDRTFLWAWEAGPMFVSDRLQRPIVYPVDWRRDEAEPDLWGFGDRWHEGEILVISPDEVPVDGEIVDDVPPSRADREPDPRGVRVVDVDPVEPELEEPTSTEVVPARPFLPASGRMLGHVGSDGFVPGGEGFPPW